MMTFDFPHLHKSVIHLMDLQQKDRIAKIRTPIWIEYPKARKIISQLEDLLAYPRMHRMPSLLLTGETNNGKTLLINTFCKRHPADDNPQGEAANVPVLYVHAPPVPEEGRFYNNILECLSAPFRLSSTVGTKESQTLKLLKAVKVKILIIDEFQQLMTGSPNKRQVLLNIIKSLSSKLKISIVAVGTKEADRALQNDPPLANRFETAFLPQWGNDNNYRRLLMSFESLLPLAYPSGLADAELSERILSMSEGYIGEIAQLISQSAVLAIRSGYEKIDADILENLDWASPTHRRYRPQLRG
ncbi:TniB family NTP-binding protein [Maridesulfovibrio sp.]|uniref:TniB family NTP-binding protein n=1 Tax=Maridesulfovibrio sp. TaxID=2795000 RepID=UPI002A18ACAB|nr:TniB family NTP-binding protein [Maridesulfovibrio sp.]